MLLFIVEVSFKTKPLGPLPDSFESLWAFKLIGLLIISGASLLTKTNSV
jgi:hypothetical protein